MFWVPSPRTTNATKLPTWPWLQIYMPPFVMLNNFNQWPDSKLFIYSRSQYFSLFNSFQPMKKYVEIFFNRNFPTDPIILPWVGRGQASIMLKMALLSNIFKFLNLLFLKRLYKNGCCIYIKVNYFTPPQLYPNPWWLGWKSTALYREASFKISLPPNS